MLSAIMMMMIVSTMVDFVLRNVADLGLEMELAILIVLYLNATLMLRIVKIIPMRKLYSVITN